MTFKPVSPLFAVTDHQQNPTIVPGLPLDSYNILSIASARIYHAQLGQKDVKWCYSQLKGTLVFGKDKDKESSLHTAGQAAFEAGKHWFRLLDATSRKPVWMFRIPAGFLYELDRPFFHTFQGLSRKFGFLFDDDDEASALSRRVIAQTCPLRPRISKNRSLSFTMRNRSPSTSRGAISPLTISSPSQNSFTHVAHVGLNEEGTIEASKGIDPAWKTVLIGNNLQEHSTQSPQSIKGQQIDVAEQFQKDMEAINNNDASDTPTSKPNFRMRRRLPTPSFTMF